MAEKPFGEMAPRNFNKEVVSNGHPVPGLGWKISDATQREIEAIEHSIRSAEQRSGSFLVD
jgi:hypothetical protein